jgi:hypothetical protein
MARKLWPATFESVTGRTNFVLGAQRFAVFCRPLSGFPGDRGPGNDLTGGAALPMFRRPGTGKKRQKISKALFNQ